MKEILERRILTLESKQGTMVDFLRICIEEGNWLSARSAVNDLIDLENEIRFVNNLGNLVAENKNIRGYT